MMSSARSCTTVIHRLHPLTKIGCSVLMTTGALAMDDPAALALLLASVMVIMLLARVRLASHMLGFMFVACLVIAAGSFLASRDPSQAARYSLRFAVIISVVPLTASTTSPLDLVRSLSRLRIPQGLLMAVIVAWRFFPILSRHAREVREARLLRGEAGSGAWYRHLLLPLIASSIDHADHVAMALEGRGFDVEAERTWFRIPRLDMADAVFGATIVGVVAVAMHLEWW